MIMIVEYYYTLTELYKILESNTGSEFSILHLLKYDIRSDLYIIQSSIYDRGDHQGRGSSIFRSSLFPCKSIVPEGFREDMSSGGGHSVQRGYRGVHFWLLRGRH
jgi:hypothetical protein